MQTWRTERRQYFALVRRKRANFWTARIDADQQQPRRLWQSFDQLLGRGRVPPTDIGASVLHEFFDAKVAGVRSATAGADPAFFTAAPVGCELRLFAPITPAEVVELILSLPDKQSLSDPLPTSLLKTNAEVLAPFLTHLFNWSLSHGIVPSTMKAAYITPILKKADMDSADPKSYRPISNLSVISKLLERLIAKQLVRYLKDNNLLPDLQSAYKPHHSTETAVLKVLADILLAVDSGNLVMLTLLDLSAAFDSVDHHTLLWRLRKSYGLRCVCFDWFKSYLSGRTQYVRSTSTSSEPSEVQYGVPQGSVLGPILFLLYTADLLQLVRSHHLTPHAYADDLQIYSECKPADVVCLQDSMSACVDDVACWMAANRLQLNHAKSEVLWCSSTRRQHQIPSRAVRIGSTAVQPVSAVRDLGIMLDAEVTMSTHVSAVVRASFAALRRIRSVRRSIPRRALLTLIQALVVSKVDYCNSVLGGLSESLR